MNTTEIELQERWIAARDGEAFAEIARLHAAMVYATYQILEQAIEGVGSLDRKAVTQYIKDHTFKTVLGPINFVNQNNPKYWTVGQWQNGKFYGVSSTGRPGAKAVKTKSGW